jgi:hypothetical protein
VRVIEQKLIAAVAVIVIMTPAGDESRWVHRELDKADELNLPMFPILVAGGPFFRLSDVQWFDARADDLPGDELINQLRALLATPIASVPVGQHVGMERRYDHAVQVGDTGRPGSAAELLRSLIADQTRILGPDHTATLRSQERRAWYVGRAGNWAESVRLYQALIPDQTRILGPDHPDTLSFRDAIVN